MPVKTFDWELRNSDLLQNTQLNSGTQEGEATDPEVQDLLSSCATDASN